MRFFDTLFGGSFQNTPREKWEGIIDTIHARLAEDRPVFFNACVELLSVLPDVTIKNRTMTPRIELAITVYQLRFARELIAAQQYVRPEDGNSFVSMLYSNACLYGSIIERNECIRRYLPSEDDDKKGNDVFLFYSDIATHITGNDAPVKEMGLLSSATIRQFALVSRLAVATTLGDRKTVQELTEAHAKNCK